MGRRIQRTDRAAVKVKVTPHQDPRGEQMVTDDVVELSGLLCASEVH